jgi:hypothetical protein
MTTTERNTLIIREMASNFQLEGRRRKGENPAQERWNPSGTPMIA